MRSRLVIDVVLYSGEADMLEFRLRMLDPVVDRFIIVEADHTFSGKKKAFLLDEQYERFRPWHDKILYERVVINPNIIKKYVTPPNTYEPDHQCWKIEYAQRNAIIKATEIYRGTELVMMSDVDEIPKREVVNLACNLNPQAYPLVFRQHVFCYSMKFMRNIMWNGTIMCSLAELRETSPQRLRDKRNELGFVDHGGWHLSYFAGEDAIRDKIESFSHQEYNKPEYKSHEHIAYCIESGEDLFDRDSPTMSVSKEQFPDYFVENAPADWWGI